MIFSAPAIHSVQSIIGATEKRRAGNLARIKGKRRNQTNIVPGRTFIRESAKTGSTAVAANVLP
jgi:hypothetical protein